MAGTHHKSKLRRIKKNQMINKKICHKDVGASIATMILSPNKKWMKQKIAHNPT
jgi:hypothetical protein